MRRAPGAALAAALAAWLLVGACSGDGDDGADGRAGAYAFTLAGTEVHAATASPPPFPEDVRAAVMETLDAYLATAVVEPLQRGRAPSGAEDLFTAAAAPRLAGPDRAALVEDGALGSGRVRQDRAAVKLTALTGPGGEVVVVTAQLDVRLLTSSPDGRLSVVRAGDLALVVEGSGWRIDSYDVRTQRDSPPPPQVPR